MLEHSNKLDDVNVSLAIHACGISQDQSPRYGEELGSFVPQRGHLSEGQKRRIAESGDPQNEIAIAIGSYVPLLRHLSTDEMKEVAETSAESRTKFWFEMSSKNQPPTVDDPRPASKDDSPLYHFSVSCRRPSLR